MDLNNKWSIDQIQQTWQLAAKLHDGQKYGGVQEGESVEYLKHIGSVLLEILNAINHSDSLDSSLAIQCAILHDTIEDTNFSYENVETLFGTAVAEGVLALTKNGSIEGKLAQMQDSLSRIKAQPKEIWAVKLADRIANLTTPPYHWTEQKKRAYMEEAMIILDTLKDGNPYLAMRLQHKIEDYQQFLTTK